MVNEAIKPKSVIDVGCGIGYWLKVWSDDFEISDLQGVEGPYVKAEMLKVPEKYVKFQDLKKPLNILKKFDLAMSLEVAEHLPKWYAHSFIESLTSLSNVILFSAAIEGQDGTYHINEQMPEYWCDIFLSKGFVPVDYIRPKIWNHVEVEWWYQQNILLFVKSDCLEQFPALADSFAHTDPNYLLRVHPRIFRNKLWRIKKTSSFWGLLKWKLQPYAQRFKQHK